MKLAGIVLAVVLCVPAWDWVSQLRFEYDLHAYARSVRRVTMPIHEKERLLDVIERLEDRVRTGERCHWLRWFIHDQIVREMLNKGIDGDEGRLIERELLKMEKDFKEQ